MNKEKINPSCVPEPPAPYTNIVKVTESNGMLFLSGVSANDGDKGLVGKGDILAQTRQIIKNITTELEFVGAKPENVTMTTTFVLGEHLEDFLKTGACNELFSALDNPADTLVGVANLAGKPWGALIEVNVIAVL